jgi:hypothetical protein
LALFQKIKLWLAPKREIAIVVPTTAGFWPKSFGVLAENSIKGPLSRALTKILGSDFFSFSDPKVKKGAEIRFFLAQKRF